MIDAPWSAEATSPGALARLLLLEGGDPLDQVQKLLKLKDLINTRTGKAMAEERHEYMLQFLDRFYKEWDPGK